MYGLNMSLEMKDVSYHQHYYMCSRGKELKTEKKSPIDGTCIIQLIMLKPYKIYDILEL